MEFVNFVGNSYKLHNLHYIITLHTYYMLRLHSEFVKELYSFTSSLTSNFTRTDVPNRSNISVVYKQK